MSKTSNTAVVQGIYAAFGKGDLPDILSRLAEDVDWTFYGPSEIPFAGHYQGRDEMARFFGTIAKTVEVRRFEPQEFIATDERVVVLGSEEVGVKANHRVFATKWAHVYTVRNGQVTQVREFYDTAAIAEAFRGQ